MDFQPGDVVRLKSGGPAMCMVAIDECNDFIDCCWIYEGEYHQAAIQPRCLVPWTESDEESERPARRRSL